jgi:hypothetical protein
MLAQNLVTIRAVQSYSDGMGLGHASGLFSVMRLLPKGSTKGEF